MSSLLDRASKAYYEGKPIMSDEAFDKLAEASKYEVVGSSYKAEIPHSPRLYSLDKVYSEQDLPFKGTPSPKLDGAAVALYFSFGKLVSALKRGNGIAGQDVTDLMITLVPTGPEGDFVQVVGELVAPSTVKNSRNYAAGSLGLKSAEEFKSRNLTFVAYSVFPAVYGTWSEDMQMLSCFFPTVLTYDCSVFPNDGTVYRIDNYEEFYAKGFTSKHPKGAIALKENKQGVVTTLLEVIWQVGRTGVISPVAILEPVEIDGATVQKATLHNIAFIKALGLEIGCKVEIIRAGEIIPTIVGRVDE